MTIADKAAPRRRPAARKPKAKPKPAREYWTLEKRADFLHHLAESANVAASARAVGMSETGVYKLRMKSEAFRAAWATALREGYVKLELMMLERAMHGTRKDVWHGGKPVGQTTEYSERLAMQLLSQHRGAVMAGPGGAAIESDAALRERLGATLDGMRARLEDE